jgi:hypothetical protein
MDPDVSVSFEQSLIKFVGDIVRELRQIVSGDIEQVPFCRDERDPADSQGQKGYPDDEPRQPAIAMSNSHVAFSMSCVAVDQEEVAEKMSRTTCAKECTSARCLNRNSLSESRGILSFCRAPVNARLSTTQHLSYFPAIVLSVPIL